MLIVMWPLATTLAGAEPLMDPNRAEAMIAHWAEPERYFLVSASETQSKKSPTPVSRSAAPKMT